MLTPTNLVKENSSKQKYFQIGLYHFISYSGCVNTLYYIYHSLILLSCCPLYIWVFIELTPVCQSIVIG